MPSTSAARSLAALALLMAVLLLAALADLGAMPAVLLGLAAGALALLILRPPETAAEPVTATAPLPARPDDSPRLREIIDALPEPMLIVADNKVSVANLAARELLGNWVEGLDVRIALRHPVALERLARPPTSGEAIEQTELVGIGEPDRPWLMNIVTLGDLSRLVYFSDRSAAIAAEKMRVDFVANASHELKTPLATILGFIETLQDDKAATDRNTRLRFLGIMLAEAKRMQQLIEDLLSLSRIEADRYRPPADSVDLIPVIDEVRDGCEQIFTEKKSRLVVENESDPALVVGDRGQLLQLLRNLVVNALKYGREGAPVTIRVQQAEGEMVRLSVIDQGEGIAPEHLPRLTERFYRVDTGRSRAVGGTGLGLAIVKHIVGRHRGRLDIRSQLGEGTKVEILLPRASRPLS